MKPSQLFRSYELLVDKADAAFQELEKEHGTCIKCERHCSDCCHAIFGLFLIEAATIKQHFDQLGRKERETAILRGDEADRDFEKVEKRLQAHENDPQMQAYTLARERIRCPLLDDNEDCLLYPYRPITCRVYGKPTKIHGKARVCGKAAFEKGEYYPAFDLDGIYKDLFSLTEELLKSGGREDPEKASLLISVSKAISTPLDDLMHETFGDCRKTG